MTLRSRNRFLTGWLLVVAALVTVVSSSLAEDPSAYAKMGTPLWSLLSERQTENMKPELVPFYVFTDGEGIVVVPQAFVASYSVGRENPVKLVIPGPQTVAESEKYPLLTLSQFMEKNAAHVNKVTSSNPVRANMLNIYTTDIGTPTTVLHMGKR